MTMETELRALILDGIGGLIDWGESPQPGASQYVVLHLISDDEGVTMQGRDGLRQSRVQVDIYAPTFGGAAQKAAAMKDLLHGYRGGNFQGVFFAGGRTPREGSDEASAIYRASLDFMVNWMADWRLTDG